MLKKCLETVMSACESVALRWEPWPELPVLIPPRPVWDNGTDYDIPTFIRLGQARARRLSRASLGRRPRVAGRAYQGWLGR